MLKKVGSFLQKVAKFTVVKVGAVALAVCGVMSSVFAAGDSVTLPTVGVDVGSYITAGITVIGVTIAVALGGFAAFWVIRKSLGWFHVGLGGEDVDPELVDNSTPEEIRKDNELFLKRFKEHNHIS